MSESRSGGRTFKKPGKNRIYLQPSCGERDPLTCGGAQTEGQIPATGVPHSTERTESQLENEKVGDTAPHSLEREQVVERRERRKVRLT